MKRAEWFVLHGRGYWAKAKKPFHCDFNTPCGPCTNEVQVGETYLATDLAKYPHAQDRAKRHVKRRYCFHCADAELVLNSTYQHLPVTVGP